MTDSSYAFGLSFAEWFRLEMTIASTVAVLGFLVIGSLYIGARPGPYILYTLFNLVLFAAKALLYTITVWWFEDNRTLTRIAFQMIPWTIVVQVVAAGFISFWATGWLPPWKWWSRSGASTPVLGEVARLRAENDRLRAENELLTIRLLGSPAPAPDI